jgi:hypothetical protein
MKSSLPSPAIELPKARIQRYPWITEYGKPMALPILVAIIPTFVHYSNNVEQLTLLNLWRMFVLNSGLAIIIYVVFLASFGFQAIKAANATFGFLIFFNIYGLAYRYLMHLDLVRIKHYTLLPFVLMVSIYAILPLTKVKQPVLVNIWNYLVLVASVLILFNLATIVPAELRKAQTEITSMPLDHPEAVLPSSNSPDIYYIILDEFVGFQAMREYWKYEEVDDFVGYLKNRGFFVAEESHGSTSDTLHEMASRLNYREYPETIRHQPLFKEIADNRVIRELGSRGYTVVVFDETNMAYPASKPMNADYVYMHGSDSIPQRKAGAYGLYLDEFGELVLDNTMAYALSQAYKTNSPRVAQHNDMIYFTLDHIADKEIASPKFVHVHLMLPHAPFAFSEDGTLMESDRFANWNYYIDTYKFSIRIAEEMIDKIFLQTDSKNPPIIILQSDHGARNHLNQQEGSVILPNFPAEYKTLIMNALYIPGYDYSSLSQDMNPINTFPIVFNHLFDTKISLRK